MNILITLPKTLIEKIISGDKKYEMRKCLPKKMRIGKDGFFVVEKGSKIIRCWCRVDSVINTDVNALVAERYSGDLCVTPQFILRYAPNGKNVWLWHIGKIVEIHNLCRDWLDKDKNPQQFTYTTVTYGEWF